MGTVVSMPGPGRPPNVPKSPPKPASEPTSPKESARPPERSTAAPIRPPGNAPPGPTSSPPPTAPTNRPIAEALAAGPRGGREIVHDERTPGAIGLVALLISLLGILGVAYTIYAFKFIAHPFTVGLGLRNLYVLSLTAALCPYVLAAFYGRIPLLFLAAPTVVAFLIGPLMSPYGIPFARDTIFNYQFAHVLLTHSTWAPGLGVTLQATTYSYYPGSGLFFAESARMLGLPLLSTFPYALPVLRLLILPPALYALTSRMVGRRAGLLAILLYLGVPSIVFNEVVQQEFAILFFLLTLLCLTYLLDVPTEGGLALRFTLVVFSGYVLLSHHMTSYVLVLWLAGLALLPLLVRGRLPSPSVRAGPIAARFIALFLLYTAVLTYPVLYAHLLSAEQAFVSLVQSSAPAAHVSTVGSSFTEVQIGSILFSVAAVTVLALLVTYEVARRTQLSYALSSALVAILLGMLSFLLLPTGFSFVALRIFEYCGLVLAPMAAWWLIRRAAPRPRSLVPGRAVALRRRTRQDRLAGPIRSALVVGVIVAIVAGGSLITINTRDQFAPPSSLLSDSALLITQQAYDDALWADAHLNPQATMWGDELAYTVFGGYGDFHLHFDGYLIFNGTNLTQAQWKHILVGEYIVLDVYLTHMTPEFYGPSTDQPTGPLAPGQVAKFTDPLYFSPVFQDSIFSIYQVVNHG